MTHEKPRSPDESDQWWTEMTAKQRKEVMFQRRLALKDEFGFKRLHAPKDDSVEWEH